MTNLLKKIGKKALLPVLAGVLSFSNIQKSKAYDWHWLINPYWQSESVVPVGLNYYGSGDVNNDGKVNQDDVEEIDDFGFFGSTVPNPEPSLDANYDAQYDGEISKKHDRADVNGDGVINQADLDSLQKYLNTGNINTIPALNWRYLDKQNKKNWAEKVIAIDRTDEIPGVSGEWECGRFSFQLQNNTKGVRFTEQCPDDNWLQTSLKQSRRFNIPFYDITTDSPSWSAAHAINGVLIGDNPMDFNDWYFVEPQNDVEAEPGKETWTGFSSIPNNGYLEIYYDYGYDSVSGAHSQTDFLRWDIENGNPELSYVKKKDIIDGGIYQTVVTENPKYDTIKPDFNSNLQNNKYYNEHKDFIYTISDTSPKDSCNFLDTLWHKVNNNPKQSIHLGVWNYNNGDPIGPLYPKKSHTDTLDIPQTEGQHSVEVYAKDIAGNLTNKVINFVFDMSPPGFNISSPQNNEIYSTKPQNLFSVSDAVSGIDTANSYIKLNGNKIGWENSHGDDLNVSEGNNTLEYYFVDKAGNPSSITKNFSYDITFPSIELETLEDTTNSSLGNLEWNIIESNPDEMWYKVNGEKTNISNLQGNADINYQEGKNSIELYVKDKTGKESSVTDTIYYKPVGINENSYEDYSVKAYPNPTHGEFNIKYNFQSPQDATINLYNINGQNLEQKIIQNDSEGISRINLTGKPGMYIYRIKTESGYEKTGKIIKK